MSVLTILEFKPIQFLLGILVVIALLLSLRIFRNKVFYRIAFLTFLLMGLALVINPNLTAYLADLLGVGRGADMIFYMFFVGYIFVTIIIYRRLLKQEDMITMLVRDNAVRNAQHNVPVVRRFPVADGEPTTPNPPIA